MQNTIIKKVSAYYLKGLNYREIGKLLDISPRTVQRYITANECKKLNEPKTTQQKAFELSAKGFSYSEVAKKLRVTKTTVYNWHKKRKEQHAEQHRTVKQILAPFL